MATTTEKQLLELERQYWQALKDGDHDAALRLSDDPAWSPERRGSPASTTGRWRR